VEPVCFKSGMEERGSDECVMVVMQTDVNRKSGVNIYG